MAEFDCCEDLSPSTKSLELPLSLALSCRGLRGDETLKGPVISAGMNLLADLLATTELGDDELEAPLPNPAEAKREAARPGTEARLSSPPPPLPPSRIGPRFERSGSIEARRALPPLFGKFNEGLRFGGEPNGEGGERNEGERLPWFIAEGEEKDMAEALLPLTSPVASPK